MRKQLGKRKQRGENVIVLSKINSTNWSNYCARWCFDTEGARANKLQSESAVVEDALYLQQAEGDLWLPPKRGGAVKLTLLPTGPVSTGSQWARKKMIFNTALE